MKFLINRVAPEAGSLCFTPGRFFVRLVAVFLRPGLISESAPRAAKVKVCRRQPPEAALEATLTEASTVAIFLELGR
jgi:hypothetical protein